MRKKAGPRNARPCWIDSGPNSASLLAAGAGAHPAREGRVGGFLAAAAATATLAVAAVAGGTGIGAVRPGSMPPSHGFDVLSLRALERQWRRWLHRARRRSIKRHG